MHHFRSKEKEKNAPSKAILRENALISDKNSFTCMICIIQPKTRDWQFHIEGRRHISLLERFSNFFENLDKQVSCKICKSYIAWKNVQNHAKFHHIVPWYDPTDKYKTFYDNHMMKFRSMYYCYLCDEIFPEWSSAYVHIDEKCHKNLREQVPSSVPPKGWKKNYNSFLSFGGTPGKDNTIDCKICNVNLEYNDIWMHIEDPVHKQIKFKFITSLVERSKTEGFSGQLALDAVQDQEGSSLCVLPQVHSLEKNSNPKRLSASSARGMICNFVIEPNNLSKDKIFEAENKLEKSTDIFDENWYSRNFPKWKMDGPSLKKIAPVLGQSVNVSNVEFVDMPIQYVICSLDAITMGVMAKKIKKRKQLFGKKEEDPFDFWCVICCCLMPNNAAINNHTHSQRHIKNRRHYGCDNIFKTKNDTEYYCKSCDTKISNFENVYIHFRSKEHLASFNAAQVQNGEVERPKDMTSVCENSSPSYDDTRPFCENSSQSSHQDKTPSCQSSSCIFVVKRNAKKSFCQICDEKPDVFTKNLNDHITSQCHVISLKRYGCDNIVPRENGIYRCICCERDFSDLENIYLHIKDKKHMSSMIKVSLNEEIGSRKKIIERSVTPNNIYQPPLGDNLLSDYIVQKIATNSSGKIDSEIVEASQCFEDIYRPDYVGKRNNPFDSFNLTPQTQSYIGKHSNNFLRSSLHNSINVYAANHSTDVYPCNSITVPSNIQKQPELSSILSSMESELTRLLEPFEENKRRRFSDNKQSSPAFNKKQIKMEKTRDKMGGGVCVNYCPICNISIPDLTELHSHMAQHLSDEFVFNKRARYHNNSATNERPAIEINTEESKIITTIDDPFWQPEVTINGNGYVDNELDVNGDLSDGTNSSTCSQSESLNSMKITIATPEIEEKFPSPGTSPAKFLKNDKPQKIHQHSPRRADMRKVVQVLDFDNDNIYDMSEKLADLKLGLRLCLVIDPATIYCLVCRTTVSNGIKNYLEHLSSLDHCEYLDLMEHDNAQFEKNSNEFSDLDLAHEYMQEINDNFVRCFICDKDIGNKDNAIEQHIYNKMHESACEQIRANAITNYEDLKLKIHCDWYSVQKYWCVPCSANMESEVNFVRHLESRKHAFKLRKPENYGKPMIYDFCQCCALLWYGYRQTGWYHCQISMHKWLSQDGHYMINELPKFAKDLLIESEQFAEDKIKYLDEIAKSEGQKVDTLIRDIENAARTKFPRAKAYTFGSRISGLGTPDSDIDVFLDCRNMYDGKESTESQMLYFMNGVRECLGNDPQSWDVEELLTKCRSPIIRAFHRSTGLACDISFEHGLAVENTKLIRTFNYTYPSCRKLILILKQWLAFCDLSGSERITSYALYWYVIFYLQKQSILPSIATLITMKRKSQIIAGWETGVSHDFTYNEPDGNLSIKELLRRFFTFYAHFDFRFDVACPLLGEIVKKRDFVDPRNLPDKMQPYIDYMKKSKNPVPFRIDSAMCIQDPFDLQHNLTKALQKDYLNRFRICCSKSLDLLC